MFYHFRHVPVLFKSSQPSWKVLSSSSPWLKMPMTTRELLLPSLSPLLPASGSCTAACCWPWWQSPPLRHWHRLSRYLHCKRATCSQGVTLLPRLSPEERLHRIALEEWGGGGEKQFFVISQGFIDWVILQHRGITEWFELGGILKLVSIPCCGQRYLPLDQVPQSSIQPGFE